MQLIEKHVNISAICPMCNNDPETILHALVTCSFSASCWSLIGMNNISFENQSFADWLAVVFDKRKGKDLLVAVMTAWAIWKNRNELVWQQKCMDMLSIVESAKTALSQWVSAQDRTFDNSLGFITPADGAELWKKPNAEVIKVNVDAAVFNESNCYSYAFIARDCHGEMIEARARCTHGTVTPELAEVFGIREALSWLKDKRWSRVELETDCLNVVQAIRGTSLLLSYFGRLIEECKQLIDESKVVLNFVKRSANTVAHFLARSTCSIADREWSVDNVQPEIMDVIRKDLN